MKRVNTLMLEYVLGTILKWSPLPPLLTINLADRLHRHRDLARATHCVKSSALRLADV